MSNIHTDQLPDGILDGRLRALGSLLEEKRQAGSIQTSQEFFEEAFGLISSFYRDMGEPNLSDPVLTQKGFSPDTRDFKSNFQKLRTDLLLLFSEMENIEGLSIDSFNYMQTEINRLSGKLKILDSLVGDLSLYSSDPLRTLIYFSDSFNDLSLIDSNSSLLSANQCEIDTTEGIVTLPVDQGASKVIKISSGRVVVSSQSPGASLGNKHEKNLRYSKRMTHDLASAFDGNSDTWFEFEKSRQDTSTESLVLDLTVALDQPEIVNYIRVNPNNFGTTVAISVNKIETFLPAENKWLSIESDLLSDDGLSLAPSTSKFAGQGIFTFSPRKVQKIRFVFSQKDSYLISTSQGDWARYAIGIRDIEIRSNKYASSGELISKQFKLLSPNLISKVSLRTTESPSEATFGVLQHYISVDNGHSWNEIRPQSSTGVAGAVSSVPEVITYNNDNVTGSIQIPQLSSTVRYKTKLSRNDQAFSQHFTELLDYYSPALRDYTLLITSKNKEVVL